MIIPDKFTPLAESTLGKIDHIFGWIEGTTTIRALFRDVADGEGQEGVSIEEFIYGMEILHLLSLVEVDLQKGVVARAH